MKPKRKGNMTRSNSIGAWLFINRTFKRRTSLGGTCFAAKNYKTNKQNKSAESNIRGNNYLLNC